MSKLESKINELERELALKRGYQAVKFVLPKSTPPDVASEIQAKMREVADNFAMAKEEVITPISGVASVQQQIAKLSPEEISVLQMLAQTALAKSTAGPVATSSVPTSSPTPSVAPRPVPNPKKARVVISENVRGEGKRFVAADDEIYVPNPENVDDFGMVSATHLKRGVMIKIPVDDLEFV